MELRGTLSRNAGGLNPVDAPLVGNVRPAPASTLADLAPFAPPTCPQDRVEAPAVLPCVPRFRGLAWAEDASVPALRARIAEAEDNPATAVVVAVELLDAAEARLRAHGVACERWRTAQGHAGLRVLPDPGTELGAVAQFLEAEVDGFRLIYAPEKLFAEATRGAVWGLHREVLAAHDLVFEGCPDPITLHEVEHAVLNYGEEQGRFRRWLGFMQSIDGGPLSEVDAAQGGYITYCSIQEIPAYASQIRALARRLDSEPSPGRDLDELEAMIRWGRALAGRLADVATRGAEYLVDHPDHAVFERRHLVPAGRDPAQTPSVLWASVERPDLRISFPLADAACSKAHEQMLASAGGGWHQARAPLLTAVRQHLTGLVGASSAVHEALASLDVDARRAREQGDPATIRGLARRALRVAV